MSGPSIDNDDFFWDLPPLPPGWDWKRCKSVPQAEWDALPAAQQSLITAYMNARRADWLVMRGADETAASRLSQLNLRRLGLIPSKPGTVPAFPPAPAPAPAPAAAAAGAGGGGGGAEADDYLTPEEVAVVEHFGLPREQVGTPLFEIAEVMHRKGCEWWGFMAFRVCGYASADGQARRDEFWRRWSKIMNDRLRRLVIDGIANAEPTGFRPGDDDDGGFDEGRFKEKFEAAMAGGILPRWRLMLDEHELLNGMGPQDIRGIFRKMLKLDDEEDESIPNRVPVGVEAGLCLMVDDGVIDSLLDEREGRRPYIIGVLSDIDDDEIPDEAEAVHFKIALDSVVDLWRQVQVQTVNVLIPPEGKIYVSPSVFEDAE
ncbi:hypothetical protein BR93DRAFT_922056 [Coniochaeta sp. PMI_546]|nr:hypothetical protein BR93DRAFT_922056 [Coniochaeta sp. PMI_546]